MNRRELITGLISLVTAPAIVRASSIMPVKVMTPIVGFDRSDWLLEDWQAFKIFYEEGRRILPEPRFEELVRCSSEVQVQVNVSLRSLLKSTMMKRPTDAELDKFFSGTR